MLEAVQEANARAGRSVAPDRGSPRRTMHWNISKGLVRAAKIVSSGSGTVQRQLARHSRYMQEPPAPRKAETDTTQPHSLGRLCPRQSRKWLGTLQDQQGALYFIPCIRQAIWQVWVAGKHVTMLLGDKRRQSRWGIAAAPPLSSHRWQPELRGWTVVGRQVPAN